MGVVPDKPRSLVLKRHKTIDLIPLRSVYTSLFSTGLHLQNSLLKVRQLEKAFDSIEKNKGKKKAAAEHSISSMLPSEESLAEWLVSFDVIQKELNACVGCLDEGMSSIEVLKHSGAESPGRSSSKASGEGSSGSVSSLSSPSMEEEEKAKVVETISEGTATERVDEVYEAVIGSEDEERRKRSTRDAGEQTDDEASDAEKQRLRMQTEQSERMLKELREVLAVKAKEREKREAAALARSGKRDEEEETTDSSTICQNSSADASVRPKKPPRTRNGDARVPFTALATDTRERSTCNGSKADFGVVSKEADGNAFLLNAKDGDEFGGDLRNDFEDSFSDYMSKQDDDDGLSCSSSSSSSDQDTVKSVPSEKNRHRQSSSSSYGETDEDEQESIDEDENDEEEASCASQSSSFKKRRSRLKSTPSLDSLRELKLHQLKIKRGATDGQLSPGDCHSLSELRSISSPDIKRLAVTGGEENPSSNYSSSPYESLDALPPRLRVAAAMSSSARKIEQGERMSLSDGDSDTSEDEEGKIRQKVLKTYRRPLRPAVNKKRPVRSRVAMKEDAEERNGHAVAIESKEEADSNTYVSKNHRRDDPLFLPPVKRPFGFDAAVALQAATKAVSGGFNGLQIRGGKKDAPAEEVFGDSSSE